ncbi:hypothetical protein Pcar_0140 [Syntrophotalea carbinolica DSM 2380]|uniref:MalT-like winged helix domain-containing protein n=1 Tax=Syntrophotalea carbinolica (strain DSM 2380 / NBRC 103641 / GraBd1) TaxID=338963 RepID=Q3A891_SYNC1|nr:ATP-binding protein [Syntrophotalea carbinolica]ABA87401.1 hypothetical protein Pcar_0140 [Syntrophotalea carbinolica DSM 2380]
MRQTAEFRSQVKLDKFYPPQVDTPRFLCRDRLVDRLLREGGARIPDILLEAQAGQGKTTVIKQFLDRSKTAFVWYQVGAEDADPGFFLTAIATCIYARFPECPSAKTAQILSCSDFALFDLQKRVDLLLNDLCACLTDDLYMVFDDLHYLLDHEFSLALLSHLFETASPRLHFILSSRECLPLNDALLSDGNRQWLRLGNRDLAFDETEITDFFYRIHHLDVPSDTIRTVARTTDGWVMGISLLGLQLAQQEGAAGFPALVNCRGEGTRAILDYFRREIFAPLPQRLHRPLLVLSLLEEIPVALAVELTGEVEIGVDFCELARSNVFLRPLDPDRTEFGLHHLFQQFLRERATVALSPQAIRRIYQRAGQFCLKREDIAQALRYLLQAGDYAAVESALQDYGMDFLATNQTATLAAILQQIPQADLSGQGWSCFYLALAYMDSAPSLALPLLKQALVIFIARQNDLGELLGLAHMISIHITTTGHYREGEEMLFRAEQLFARVGGGLDVAMTILVARSLAMGYCIFLADVDEATRFASLALSLARQEQLANFEAAMLMVMGYIHIFAGHTVLARMYMEQAAPCVQRAEVGAFNSLSIRMMLFNFLYIEGDFANYFEQKNQLVEVLGNAMFSQSIAAPFCTIWEMDIAINQGRFTDALALANQALGQQPPLSPHLRSQVLQLQSVVLGLLDQPDRAWRAAEQSQQLRELSGGRYFVTLNQLMVGLSCFHCGRPVPALQRLSDGIEAARQMPTEYLQACGLLHRAAVYLALGEQTLAGQDIAQGLGLMRRNAYRHFWGWAPAAMQKILSFAVAHRIETDYARELAAERLGIALSEDGSAIALLDIRTLGGLHILLEGKPLLAAEALTPLQRELLCLLVSAPKCKMPQGILQLHFWPDSSVDAARMKFDTLVSRLRKTMTQVLPDNTAHRYLKREKGMLWLAHCRVDAHDFLTAVNRGLRHACRQESWQAGNAFTTARSL